MFHLKLNFDCKSAIYEKIAQDVFFTARKIRNIMSLKCLTKCQLYLEKVIFFDQRKVNLWRHKSHIKYNKKKFWVSSKNAKDGYDTLHVDAMASELTVDYFGIIRPYSHETFWHSILW